MRQPGNKNIGCRGLGHPLILPLCLLAIWATSSCENNDLNQKGPRSEKRMMASSGEFMQGYRAGQSDAENSLTDVGPQWMWLWAMEDEYRRGYDQGWADGRKMKSLRQMETKKAAEEPASSANDPAYHPSQEKGVP